MSSVSATVARRGAGVAHDVAQQLARRAEQQVVDRTCATPSGQSSSVDVDGEVVTAGAGGEVADRLGETDAVEHGRVQLGDGRAQHARRFREGVVDARERPRVIAVADVLQVVAGGEEVLQGAVVQSFREHLALALLDVHEVVEEAGAVGDAAVRSPGRASAGSATGRSPRSRRWRASPCASRSSRWARRWPPASPSSPAGTRAPSARRRRRRCRGAAGWRRARAAGRSRRRARRTPSCRWPRCPASSVSVATTARSTNRPSQAHRATAGPPVHAQRPKATAPTRVDGDDHVVRRPRVVRRHDGEGEGEEHHERAAQQQLEADPPVGVLEHGRRQLQHRVHPCPYADPAPVREERWPRARSGCEW